ncbi:MAG: hypothetical protein ACPG61_14875, partial [Paracoccaceae bacterium]
RHRAKPHDGNDTAYNQSRQNAACHCLIFLFFLTGPSGLAASPLLTLALKPEHVCRDHYTATGPPGSTPL